MEEKTAQERHLFRDAFALMIQDLKACWAAVLAVAGYIIIGSLLFGTVCPIQLMFGIPCPGCGLTRAAILLAKAHPLLAFRMHPFLYGWIIIGADFAVNRYFLRRRSKELPVLLGLLCVGMLLFYGYRMLTLFPHTEPMQPITKGLIRIIPEAVQKLLGKS